MKHKTRSIQDHDKANEIIKILIKEGVIPKEGFIGDQYLDTWNAMFEIVDLFKQRRRT